MFNILHGSVHFKAEFLSQIPVMSHENLIFVQAQPVSNQPGSYSLQGESDQRTENRPKSEARGSNSLLRENTVDN